MKSYILRNVVFFASVVIISMTTFGFVHFYSLNRELNHTQTRVLGKINSLFTADLKKIIKDDFKLISFLKHTSYPEVAINYNMFEQFYETVRRLQVDNAEYGIILFNEHGRVVYSKNVDIGILKRVEKFSFNENSENLVFDTAGTTYITPLVAEKGVIGYLGGILKNDVISDSIRSEYYRRTKDYQELKPTLDIQFDDYTADLPQIKYKQQSISNSLFHFNSSSVILMIGLSALIIFSSTFIFRKLLESPLNQIVYLIDQVGLGKKSVGDVIIPEDPLFKKITQEILRVNEYRVALENESKIRSIKEKISETAAQVAHDIRSPLAALTAATQGLSNLEEDKRIMIRSAVQRINDIANDLAYRGDQTKSEEITSTDSDKSSTELLTSIIDSLVSEKRLQFRARLGVNIEASLGKSAYGLFAKVQPVQFKRVLSNLVNNAVEAIKDSGFVTVKLDQNKDDEIEISVTDTGSGISPENLERLMQKGVSIGKKDGQGLGLFHARESIESWGGKIRIESNTETPPAPSLKEGVQSGSGTVVTITLPRQTEPDWFVPELKIYQGTKIVILDDDNSIHQIWTGRFDSLGSATDMYHFSNGDGLREWIGKNPSPGAMLILCDYEIIGSSESGLDVIKELNLADHTVLVTSRYEEKNVRDECERLGIKLLPKNLAGFVPIHIKEIPNDLEYVLIDDSRLNRQTWEIMARRQKKQLITFEKAKDFYDVMDRINKDIKLYVDYNLGHGENGGEVSRKVSERGFSKIFLATGDSNLDKKTMPWLSGIHGKGVPFGEQR